jgi:Rod binding domain-containing protein
VIPELTLPGLEAFRAPAPPKAGASGGPPTADQVKLRRTAAQMESLFYGMLMRAMRAGVPQNPYMNGGQAERIYTQLFDEAIAERAARTGRGLGIADLIVKAYDRHVRATSRPPSEPPEETPPDVNKK